MPNRRPFDALGGLRMPVVGNGPGRLVPSLTYKIPAGGPILLPGIVDNADIAKATCMTHKTLAWWVFNRTLP